MYTDSDSEEESYPLVSSKGYPWGETELPNVRGGGLLLVVPRVAIT